MKKTPGVTRLAAGRYQVRVQFYCPKTGRRREAERVVTAQSVAEAARLRDQIREEALAHNKKVERLKLGAFAASWFRTRLPKLASSTAARYAFELDTHIVPAFGDYFIDTITKDDLTAWRDAQRTKPASVNSVLRTLKLVVRDAVQELRLGYDPTVGVSSVPEHQDEFGDDSGKVLTAEQLQALLEAAEQAVPQWYPLIRLLAVTGMRFSEATALKWSDVDLDAGVLTINRAQVRGKVGAPKTRKSRRALPIEPGTIDILKAHRARLLATQAPGLAEGWCFPSDVGGLLFNAALTKPLKKAAKAAGLHCTPTPHWFRRTLNRLLAQASTERVQMAMLGHVTDRMRLHYDHVFLDEKRNAVVRALSQ